MNPKTIGDICEEFMEKQADAEQGWDDAVSAFTDFVEELLDDQRKACTDKTLLALKNISPDESLEEMINYACLNATGDDNEN